MNLDFRIPLFLASLTAALGLWAQGSYFYEDASYRIQWEGHSRIHFQFKADSLDVQAKVLEPSGRWGLTDMPSSDQAGILGLNFLGYFVKAGHYFAQGIFRATTPEGSRLHSALFRREGDRWVLEAYVDEPAGSFRANLFPLADGGYLGVFSGRKGSPGSFRILRKGGGSAERLRTARILPPLHDPPDAGGTPGFWDDFAALDFALTRDFYVIASRTFGIIWCFSSRDGHLASRTLLYPEVRRGGYLGSSAGRIPLLHSFDPMPDGSLWLVLRQRELIPYCLARSAPLSPGERSLDPHDPDAMEAQVAIETARFPGLAWYRLNPAKGTFRRINPAPKGARTRLESTWDLLNYRWRPGAGGALECAPFPEDTK